MPPKQRQIKMESKSALSAMQKLEGRSDEELEAEPRFRAAAQAILGARAAERMDAKRSREHFRAAIAAGQAVVPRLTWQRADANHATLMFEPSTATAVTTALER